MDEQYTDMSWKIAESENYIIKGEYEDASLIRKTDGSRITCVGDFYGDPAAGIIDKNEKFCVTVGCGVIVYRLKEPFEDYMYNTITDQWYEFGREPDNTEWIEEVKQISDDEVEITDEDGKVRIIKIDL